AFKQIVWQGDQYRLANPREGAVASMSYVAKNRSSAMVFNYLVSNRYGQGSSRPVKLKGLDPAAVYRITEVSLYPGVNSMIDPDKKYSGQFLMDVGFNPQVNSGRTSVVLKIEQVK
ncbi:MAG: GH36 C-terminal domain-containing protein, partial [Chitinophagaceae bacterium]|nr:GH36 C-terminal domain-containing protein [Chitinophagaceae bacterium]